LRGKNAILPYLLDTMRIVETILKHSRTFLPMFLNTIINKKPKSVGFL
jgi:hypothetical protein